MKTCSAARWLFYFSLHFFFFVVVCVCLCFCSSSFQQHISPFIRRGIQKRNHKFPFDATERICMVYFWTWSTYWCRMSPELGTLCWSSINAIGVLSMCHEREATAKSKKKKYRDGRWQIPTDAAYIITFMHFKWIGRTEFNYSKTLFVLPLLLVHKRLCCCCALCAHGVESGSRRAVIIIGCLSLTNRW